MKKPDLNPAPKASVAGKTVAAPAKPSNKAPAVIKAQAKPMAKPAPKKAKASAPDSKEVSPYGRQV